MKAIASYAQKPTIEKSINREMGYAGARDFILVEREHRIALRGGVKPENCRMLADAGADFVAAITAIWNNPDGPAKAVREFQERLGSVIKSRKKQP